MALFARKIATGISALNAVTEVLNMTEVGNINEIAFLIVGSAGIIAGAIQAEEAHDPTYAGIWAPVGAPANAIASGIATIKASGVSMAMRGRVSTLVNGGTVDIWVVGR